MCLCKYAICRVPAIINNNKKKQRKRKCVVWPFCKVFFFSVFISYFLYSLTFIISSTCHSNFTWEFWWSCTYLWQIQPHALSIMNYLSNQIRCQLTFHDLGDQNESSEERVYFCSTSPPMPCYYPVVSVHGPETTSATGRLFSFHFNP